MTGKVYAFDPHGTNPENYITDEVQTIPSGNGRRIIIPINAPFFYRDFAIKHNDVKLVEGKDYFLGNRYAEGSHTTAQDLFGSIWLINEALTGQVTIENRVVGTDFSITRARAIEYIATNPDVIADDWTHAMGEERFFPIVTINFDREDWHGEQELIAAIDDLGDTIVSEEEAGNDSTLHELLVAWLNDIKEVINTSDFKDHINAKTNVHGLDWYEIDALKIDGIALSASKVYGKTFTQLADYVNARGIQPEDLNRYVNRIAGSNITGDIVLKDGRAFLSMGDDPTFRNRTLVDLSHSVWKMFSDINMLFASDVNLTKSGDVEFKIGQNVMRIASSGNATDKNALTINDHAVLTRDNLDEHVSGGNVQVRLKTADTATANMSGDGSTANPLQVDLILPNASLTQSGVSRLVTDESDRSKDKLAVPWLLLQIRNRMVNKVPTTRQVNGQELVRPVEITKLMLGIERIENTSDANMPVNGNHTTILATLADDNHTHTYDQLGIGPATQSTFGLGKLLTSIGQTADGGAVATEIVKKVNDDAAELKTEAEGLLPLDALNLQQYGGLQSSPVQSSYTMFTFSIEEEVPFFYRGVEFTLPPESFDIQALYPDQFMYSTFYLYVMSDTVTAYYELTPLRMADDDGRILIATIETDSLSIISGSVQRVTRLGNFREFDEHVNGDQFHGIDFSKINASSIGLAGMVNGEIYDDVEGLSTAQGDVSYASRNMLVNAFGGSRRFKVYSGEILFEGDPSVKEFIFNIPDEFIYSDCIIYFMPVSQMDSMGGWSYAHWHYEQGLLDTQVKFVANGLHTQGNFYNISATFAYIIVADEHKKAARG